MNAPFRSVVFLGLIFPLLLSAQVIFSRRVYSTRGRSWQQIWRWDAPDGTLKPLTHSLRDHSQPRFSRDGEQVLFVSGAGGVWALDLRTGGERELWRTAGAISLELIGVAKDGSPLIEKEWVVNRKIRSGLFKGGAHPFQFAGLNEDTALSPDGARMVRLAASENPEADPPAAYITDTATGKSRVPIGKCGEPAWSPDSKSVACTAGYVTDAATGKSRISIGNWQLLAWSADGGLGCASESEVVVFDRTGHKQIARAALPALGASHYPQEMRWPPGGAKLLLGVYGENANSGSPQSDYMVLDLASKIWARAGSGNGAVWIPDRDAIAYRTQRDLIPLPPSNKHSVWSSQLVVYDFAARREIPVTSGLTDNQGPVIDYH